MHFLKINSFRTISSGLAALIMTIGAAHAEEPVQKTSPESKPPMTIIEHDPVSGASQLYLIKPDGEKRLLQTFPGQSVPDQSVLSARPIPPAMADYLNAIDSIAENERYVLGVQLKPIPEGLHERLGIEPDCGLIVASLMPGKPAEIAGIQRHDILLKLNGVPMSQPGDVVRAVNDSKDKPITVTLLRDTEPFEVKVTPAKLELPSPQSGGESPTTTLTPGTLPPGIQIVGPGMIVPSSRVAETQMLRAEIAELRAKLDRLSELVEKIQAESHQK